MYGIAVTAEPYAHTDKAFTVSTTLSDNVKQRLNWHIYRDGNEVSWADTVTGTLSNTGGSIQLKNKGKYTLKATAFDETSCRVLRRRRLRFCLLWNSIRKCQNQHTGYLRCDYSGTKELDELPVVWSVLK